MIFSRAKARKQTEEEEAQVTLREHPAIKRIWGNTELSREEFDVFYLSVLADVIENAKDDTQIDHILRLVSGVMVARGGFRLGKSLPIEDSDRISNPFTLALVTCVLLEIIAVRECSKKGYANVTATALALLQQKIGDVAFACLWQMPVVFNDICAYFLDSNASEIRVVLARYFTREDNARYRYLLPSFAEADVSCQASNVVITADAQGRKTSLAHQYTTWLNRELADESMSINKNDSVAHLSANGDLFLIKDMALQGFADLIDKDPTAISRSLTKHGFIRRNQSTCDFFKGSVNGRFASGHILIDAKALLTSISNEKPSELLMFVD